MLLHTDYTLHKHDEAAVTVALSSCDDTIRITSTNESWGDQEMKQHGGVVSPVRVIAAK